MAEQTQTVLDNLASALNPPPVPKTDDTAKLTMTANTPPSSAAEDPAKPAVSDEKDAMRDLLDRMDRVNRLLSIVDPGLAPRLQSLSRQGSDPESRSHPVFRHQVAYALQDLEKSDVGRISIPPELRDEMTRLAGTAPGLKNERMQSLMQMTSSLGDRLLIKEIRDTGSAIAFQADQLTSDIQNRIEVLENKVRLGQRVAEAERLHVSTHGASKAITNESDNQPVDPGRTMPLSSVNDEVQRGRQFNDAASNAVRSPGNRSQGRQQTQSRPILDTILSAMRTQDQGNGAPWDPPPTPMADRLSAFEKKMADGADERVLDRATKSGRVALDALQGFSAGEGAAIMSRIQDAAKADPGGMPAVMAEMRQGGRFSELRQQFNVALETERGVATAYNKATSALGQYSQDRTAVQDIISRRSDANAMTSRFEQMDAEIGKAASSTPSRSDGRSLLDDIAQKAAEIMHRAIDTVKSVFSRSPSAEAASRPGPSPSP